VNDLFEILQTGWAWRSLITASVIGITCGVLGVFIVLRNMSLIGDALSHAILPGIFLAYILVGYSTIGFFIGSIAAGLITALMITWIQSRVNTKNDAAIGIVFTAMFSIGVIGISSLNHQQGTHIDLKDFLFGNVLGISTEDIYLSLLVMVYVLASVIIFYRYLFITTFQSTIATTMGIPTKKVHYYIMLVLSFTVVVALRSVGVILVVALLITPAATALLLSERLKKVVIISGAIGLLSSFTGFIFAILLDTVPGPAIVLVSTLFYFVAVLFAPEKGLVFKWKYRLQEKARILEEDILKLLTKLPEKNTEVNTIATKMELSENTVKRSIRKLRKDGLINSNDISLSLNGEVKAGDLVRAHRLWESYQVNSMGLDVEQVHDDAERLEHHLTDDFLDELNERLGYPESDPHGSPIPTRVQGPSLHKAELNRIYKVLKNQENEIIESYLWEMGIAANEEVTIVKKDKNFVSISNMNGQIRKVPVHIATKVIVA
jgi:ABC-type Mn2+/Zn2+ transport system permease subunit/Mn-dependent DtxR family transcriptional regulator